MKTTFTFLKSMVSGKNYFKHYKKIEFYSIYIYFAATGLIFEFAVFLHSVSGRIAALPLKKAAEQQNICRLKITWIAKSCRAAEY